MDEAADYVDGNMNDDNRDGVTEDDDNDETC